MNKIGNKTNICFCNALNNKKWIYLGSLFLIQIKSCLIQI